MARSFDFTAPCERERGGFLQVAFNKDMLWLSNNTASDRSCTGRETRNERPKPGQNMSPMAKCRPPVSGGFGPTWTLLYSALLAALGHLPKTLHLSGSILGLFAFPFHPHLHDSPPPTRNSRRLRTCGGGNLLGVIQDPSDVRDELAVLQEKALIMDTYT